MSPSDLAEVQALLASEEGTFPLAPCRLRRLIVGSGVLHRLREVVGEISDGGRIALIVDTTAIRRQGEDIKSTVLHSLQQAYEVRLVVLNDGHSELHVTEEVVQQGICESEGADVIVALGGGTISDIGKLVGRERSVPVVTVMTAASVDGFTDDVSVILRDGVKRTIPSVWPTAVIADAETIAEAPARMNRAGYGEMTSMYVACADWRMAALIGIDDSYHPGPVALLSSLATELDACASGVGEGQPLAVQRLTWALALRGIATGVAGTTACLSGVEHLISHMLDLRAAELKLPTGLHGEQVGIGAVIAASAWEMLADRLDHEPTRRVQISTLDAEASRHRVATAFDAVDPSGRIAAECWKDYAMKVERMAKLRVRIDEIVEHWPEYLPLVQALARPSMTIANGLRAAGTPALLSELEGVSSDVAKWAVGNCGLMRNRFTVVDLLTSLGWWETSDVAEVMARAENAAAVKEVSA